jgi:proline dehydrogenase
MIGSAFYPYNSFSKDKIATEPDLRNIYSSFSLFLVMLSFNNTANAFAYKSTKELKKAYRLFWLMGKLWLVKIGTKIIPFAVKRNFPFVRVVIRNTIFKEFVGGETLKEITPVINKLNQYNVSVILDYGVEGGTNDISFDASTEEFIHAIHYAATQKNIPFISIKITGIAQFELLEKIATIMNEVHGTLLKRYAHALNVLNHEEKKEWDKVSARMLKICEAAFLNKIAVLVDAEETWIQDPIDVLTMVMMDSFNRQQVVLFNTIQMYRNDRRVFLEDCYKAAVEKGFILGIKLVRGAYMEKERLRAKQLNYPSPIQPDKETCDLAYNDAMQFCINHLDNISLIVGSHNEQSNLLSTQLMQQKNIPVNHPHIHFSQLFGMSDHISFNLAKEGYAVSKYLPFGPLKEVIPYLMRRAEENSSLGGQTGRELSLIKRELKRRQR